MQRAYFEEQRLLTSIALLCKFKSEAFFNSNQTYAEPCLTFWVNFLKGPDLLTVLDATHRRPPERLQEIFGRHDIRPLYRWFLSNCGRLVDDSR
jgi:hypothetical protein